MPVDHEQIIQLRAEGATLTQISEKFGITRQRVHQIIVEEKEKQAGILKPSLQKKQRNLRILECRRNGYKVEQIAKDFGISISHTYRILRKRQSG